MSARVLVFSAVVIAAGVLALILVTSRESDSSDRDRPDRASGAQDRGSADPSGSRPGLGSPRSGGSRIPTGAPPARPELKVTESSADPGFEAETRDEAWAAETEKEIRDRVEDLLQEIRGKDLQAVGVSRVECKSTRCRLRVSGGDGKRFMQFVEALQGERGFYGSASQLLLQGYTPTAESGDRASVTAVLVYDRPAP
jgi:hypothetical protein